MIMEAGAGQYVRTSDQLNEALLAPLVGCLGVAASIILTSRRP